MLTQIELHLECLMKLGHWHFIFLHTSWQWNNFSSSYYLHEAGDKSTKLHKTIYKCSAAYAMYLQDMVSVYVN